MSEGHTTPGDQSIRDRIVSEFDRNFLVEAGAGSGKTYSLAMRMAAGIEAGVFAVDGMAAVTFTRKAAAELRGRFQEALETRLRQASGSLERGRLQQALDGIERLFTGTIHAFCAQLLRERPVDARVAPGFEDLDEAANVHLRKQAWRDFIVEARGRAHPELVELLEADVRPYQLDQAFSIVCEHEDVEFDRGSGGKPAVAPVWKAVRAFWSRLEALKPAAFDPETTCPVQQRFDELARRLEVGRADDGTSLARWLQRWPGGKVTQKYWDGNGKAVKDLVADFRASIVGPYLTDWYAYLHRLAMSVLLEGRQYFADVRRRHNVVNYVDLLQLTARMLRECPHVRRALQAKYRWLFIDEFQDTDPIQADIFLMLAADERPADAARDVASGAISDPFALPLRPGALFVVGDPKQSIFRFRRADIDIYNRVAARIRDTGGECLPLTTNFRSLPGVCALPNAVFPPLFGEPPWSPVYSSLVPVRRDTAAPCIAKLTMAADKADAATAEEAAAIAAYIQAQVAANGRHYGEFLVLTRMRPRLGAIAAALDALEIPVEVSGAGFFCKSPEVRSLALLLVALADPLDSVALVGVLRGPLFGIADPELFRFRQAGGRFELTAPLPEDGKSPVAPASVVSAMQRLRHMLGLTWELPLAAAVDRILEETGWLALAATQPAGAAAGRLLQAIDRVREIVEEGGGLAEAADALLEEHASNEAEALPLEPGRLDVVRLMNLHKAKGLEAPVVILADAARDWEFPIQLRVQRTGAKAIGHLRLVWKREGARHETVLGQPRDWQQHEDAERRYVEAERLRLLYVASTRAEDLLVVCRAPGVKGKKVWREFEPHLANAPEVAIAHPAGPPESRRSIPSAEERAAAAAAREEVSASLRSASWARARVTGPAVEGRTRVGPSRHSAATDGVPGGERTGTVAPAVVEAAQADGPSVADAGAPGSQAGGTTITIAEAPEARPAPGTAEDSDIGGALWGSLVHGLLEHAVRHTGAGRADLDRLARWLTVETPDLRPFVPAALDLVDDLRRAPLWAELREAREVHVEVPFAIRLEGGERLGSGEPVTQPTIVRGVIDLVYAASDETGWRLLDYKTDRQAHFANGNVEAGTDAALLQRHGAQLEQYNAAWERVTTMPVTRQGIVAVRSKRTVWIGGTQPA